MMSFVNLKSFYVSHGAGGASVANLALTIRLGDGTTVDFPVPFIPVDDTLAITPLIQMAGESAVRVDLAGWAPARYGADQSHGFPCAFYSQELAVTVGRAFDADPTTSWRDSFETKLAWLRAWALAHGVALDPTIDGEVS